MNLKGIFKLSKRKLLITIILVIPVHFALQFLTPIYNYLPFATLEYKQCALPNPAIECPVEPVLYWNYFSIYLFILLAITYFSANLVNIFLDLIHKK